MSDFYQEVIRKVDIYQLFILTLTNRPPNPTAKKCLKRIIIESGNIFQIYLDMSYLSRQQQDHQIPLLKNHQISLLRAVTKLNNFDTN